MATPTPVTVSPSVKTLVDAFTAKFPDAGKELIRWNPITILLINEAVKQTESEGFGIKFGGFSEDWSPSPGQSKQDYPFTLAGIPGRFAEVFVPKHTDWLGKETLVILKAITHFCFELQNAKNSTQLQSIDQKVRSRGFANGADYAKAVVGVEVDSGIRTGKMLDGSIYFGFTSTTNVKYQDPSKHLLKLYYDSCQSGVTKASLVSTELQTTYVSGKYQGKTREYFYTQLYNSF